MYKKSKLTKIKQHLFQGANKDPFHIVLWMKGSFFYDEP